MKLPELARAYIQSVELEERSRTEGPALTDEAGELRGSLHALWMDALREEHIPFADRADAARIAYKLIHESVPAR